MQSTSATFCITRRYHLKFLLIFKISLFLLYPTVTRKTIAYKIFSYKQALQDLDLKQYLQNPPTCDCSHSPYNYSPSGHVITRDKSIIQHENLRKVISHGPKFMDSIEDYARARAKREEVELDTLSEWVKTIRSLIKRRIHKLKYCVNDRPKSVLIDKGAIKCLSSLHDKYVVVPADRTSYNIVFVCKSYYYECLVK